MQQVQITITNPSPAMVAAIFGGEAHEPTEEVSTTAAAPGEQPKRRGRKSNAQKEAEAAAARQAGASAATADDDLGGDDLDDGLGDEPAKEVDLENDLIPAFKAFVKHHGSREPAVKILNSYKCQSVRELPKDKYAEVMAKLKV